MPDHCARTGPGTVRTTAVAVLAVLVPLLLTALGLAAPSPGTTSGPAAVAAVDAGHHRDAETRADDGHDTVCTVGAATRQAAHREHPAPPGHPATRTQGTIAPPARPARLPAPAEHVPSSTTHPSRDRGRAPPLAAGT